MVVDTSTSARRLLRRIVITWSSAAGVFASLALISAALGLVTTAVAATALAAAAVALARRAARSLRRQRGVARARRAVGQQLNALATAGWVVEVEVPWMGRGRVDCAARSRTGIGFAIEAGDRSWHPADAESARHKAAWLAGENWARSVVPVVCVANGSASAPSSEGGTIVCTAEQLVNVLRRGERESLLTGLRPSGEPLVARLARSS